MFVHFQCAICQSLYKHDTFPITIFLFTSNKSVNILSFTSIYFLFIQIFPPSLGYRKTYFPFRQSVITEHIASFLRGQNLRNPGVCSFVVAFSHQLVLCQENFIQRDEMHC